MLLTCPNCNAEIEAGQAQVFVNCMYCGVEIQTQDIVEVRHVNTPNSLEKMLSDGEIYYKVKDYYRAERKFREVIKHYPGKREGYEGLLRIFTRGETEYPLSHREEVYRLLERLEALTPEVEKADFSEYCKGIRESYVREQARVEMEMSDWENDLEELRGNNTRKYNVIVMDIISLLLLLAFVHTVINYDVPMLGMFGLYFVIMWLIKYIAKHI